jgi:hypothetical protein
MTFQTIDLDQIEGQEEVRNLAIEDFPQVWDDFLTNDAIDPHKAANQWVEFHNLTGHTDEEGRGIPMFSDVPKAFAIFVDVFLSMIMANGWIPVFESKASWTISTLIRPYGELDLNTYNPVWTKWFTDHPTFTSEIYPDILALVKANQIERFFLSENDWEITALDYEGIEYKTKIFWNVDGNTSNTDHRRFNLPETLDVDSFHKWAASMGLPPFTTEEYSEGRFTRIKMIYREDCIAFDIDHQNNMLDVVVYDGPVDENPNYIQVCETWIEAFGFVDAHTY